MNYANIDIKMMIKEKGYSQKEIAKILGITETHFSRMLGKELEEEEKTALINAINGDTSAWKRRPGRLGKLVNTDIKMMIQEKGYSQKLMAEKLGINPEYFSRILSKELGEREKTALINAINGDFTMWRRRRGIGKIVYCKDCKWRTESSTAWHPCTDMATNDYWFCADGEGR